MKSNFSFTFGLLLAIISMGSIAFPVMAAIPTFVMEGTPDGITLPLSVDNGDPSISSRYQWYRNGVLIKSGMNDGSHDPSLVLPEITPAVVGNYKARVINGNSSADGDTMPLIVTEAYPGAVSALAGQKAVLKLRIALPPGLAVVWQKDGNPLAADPRFTFDINGVFMINEATPGDFGSYTALVADTVIATRELLISTDKPQWTNVPPLLATLSAAEEAGIPLAGNVQNGVSQYAAAGLPRGLTINPATGFISGITYQPGTYSVTLSATNAAGTSKIKTRLRINPLPAELVGTFTAQMSLPYYFDYYIINELVSWGEPKQVTMTISPSGIATAKVLFFDRTTASLTLPLQIGFGSTMIVFFDTREVDGTLAKLHNGFLTGAADSDGRLRITAVLGDTLRGWKQTWNARTKPATVFAGQHTFTCDYNAVPWLVASVGVSKSGVAVVSGYLQDGTPFTSSGPLGPAGEVMFNRTVSRGLMQMSADFGPLPPDGFIIGTLAMNTSTGVTGSVTWLGSERVVTGENSLVSITASAAGGRYSVPTATVNALQIPAAPANARLLFTNLVAAAGVTLNLTAPAKVVLPTGRLNPRSTTLSIQASTGLFVGSLTQPTSTSVEKGLFRGVILHQLDGTMRGQGFCHLPLHSVYGDSFNRAVTLESNL